MVNSYHNLGKDVRDLFDKQFKLGFLNFDFKTKTQNDIDVTCGGKREIDGKSVNGFLETKMKVSDGVTMKTNVDTNWILKTTLEVKDKAHEGVSHELISTFDTDSGKKSALLKNTFKHEKINIGLDIDAKSRYPGLLGHFLLPIPQYEHFVVGAHAVANTEDKTLTKYVYSAGFKHGDLKINASLTDHKIAELCAYQKHEDVEMGFKMGWKKDSRETNFGAVVQYKPSKEATIKVKMDNDCIIGLAYKLKLNKDAEMTLCTQLDGKDLQSGGHKYGFAVSYGN